MKIAATVKNVYNQHEVQVETNGSAQTLQIPPKANGYGSSVNGGEMLLLALATCFCNDIYREAGKKNMVITGVEVTCTADFGAEGEPGGNFQYKVKITSEASETEIRELIRHTDQIAEVHNTLRKGTTVTIVE
jgi:uncharacterized OsmC-like protein